jgi:hypothetical protein
MDPWSFRINTKGGFIYERKIEITYQRARCHIDLWKTH